MINHYLPHSSVLLSVPPPYQSHNAKENKTREKVTANAYIHTVAFINENSINVETDWRGKYGTTLINQMIMSLAGMQPVHEGL